MRMRAMVMDESRIIHERWTFGVCENCHQNPEKVQMTKEALVSGDAGMTRRSETEVWVCPKCGYCRRL
jgi:uncharacterized protein with PIN domain